MKKNLFVMAIFGAVAASTFHMADEDSASTGTEPGAPSQASLLARVEALFAKGVAGVEAVFHDALSAVEEMFSTDDGSTLDVSVSDEGNDGAATVASASPAVADVDAGNASSGTSSPSPDTPATPTV